MSLSKLPESDRELIAEWQAASRKAKELWAEINRKGLGLLAMGIDPEKRDSAWKNPVLVEKPTGAGSGSGSGKKRQVVPDLELELD